MTNNNKLTNDRMVWNTESDKNNGICISQCIRKFSPNIEGPNIEGCVLVYYSLFIY
jgi:hypothetical protein